MVALFLTSSTSGSGKTTLGAGLAKHLQKGGKKIGFFRPTITENQPAAGNNRDAAFMKETFSLEAPLDHLSPAIGGGSSLSDKIKEAYARVSADKDVVIIEDSASGQPASRDIVRALNAKVIIVEGYSNKLLQETSRYRDFGEHLLGVVVNKVPGSRLESVRAEAAAQLGKEKITLLGVLPEDRTLLAPTVGELAEHLHGKIVSGAEKADELVENFMLEAKTIDPGLEYFGRKVNKAAIIRSERPDMQIAALETSTRSLIVTGDRPIMPIIRQRVEEKKIPLVLSQDKITAVAASIENIPGQTRFNQEKLPALSKIMEQHFDFAAVYRGLGLTG